MQQAELRNQKVVVGKTRARAAAVAEVLQSPKSARKLRCCWQGQRLSIQPAKSLQRNVLGPELRCCWQDGAVCASGPGPSVAGDSVPRRRDASRDSLSSNRRCGRATCANYPDRLRGRRDRMQSSLCGSRCAAAAGNPARRIPVDEAETSRAESSSGNNGNAWHPYGRLSHRPRPLTRIRDLEPDVECLPRPRQWASSDYIAGENAGV